MPRHHRTIEDMLEIQERIKNLEQKRLLFKRKQRLYNRFYRKSKRFRVSWILRISYILIFFYLSFSDYYIQSVSTETVCQSERNSYIVYSKNGNYRELNMDFITNKDHYSGYFIREFPPPIYKNDTILIFIDLFSQPRFFMEKGWPKSYPIYYYFDRVFGLINLLLVIITAISLAFNDGLYRFNDQVIRFTCVNIGISAGIYILSKFLYLLF